MQYLVTRKCVHCSIPLVLREPKAGQSWKPFLGCPNYPKCKYTYTVSEADDLDVDRIVYTWPYDGNQEKSLLERLDTKREIKENLYTNGIKYPDRYVYFIKADNGLTKIGKSENPITRIASLKSSSPHHLSVIMLIAHLKERDLEREYHRRFKSKRIHGEWFDLTDEDIQSIRGEQKR